MSQEAADPRWFMAKLEALRAELVEAYETHVYWQNVAWAKEPLTFCLDSGDEPVLIAAKLDLNSLPAELFNSIKDAQLSSTYTRYGTAWDEIGKLAVQALSNLTAPDPKPQAPAPIQQLQ